MTFAGAAQYFERAATAFDRNIREAEERSGQEYERAAFRYSSGPFTLKQLRRMGHPYARRHPKPLLDPGVINVQSGAFRSAWRRDGPNDVAFLGSEANPFGASDRGLVTAIYNEDPKAAFLEQPDGAPASLMVQRPVDEKIAAAAEPERERRIERAIAVALHP